MKLYLVPPKTLRHLPTRLSNTKRRRSPSSWCRFLPATSEVPQRACTLRKVSLSWLLSKGSSRTSSSNVNERLKCRTSSSFHLVKDKVAKPSNGEAARPRPSCSSNSSNNSSFYSINPWKNSLTRWFLRELPTRKGKMNSTLSNQDKATKAPKPASHP